MGVPATFTLASLSALLKGAEAAGQRVRAVVVNFPHNPTGFLPTRAEFEQLVELCRGAHGGDGCFLFCDEMYRDLEFEGLARRLPSAVDMGYDKAVAGVSTPETPGFLFKPRLRSAILRFWLRWR